MRIRSIFMAVALATLATACAEDNVTPGLEGADDIDPSLVTDSAKADGLGATATYYSITRDLRRCASPMCGGFFVSRVNRSWTQCDDGAWRNACYVADVDFQGALGMSDDEAAELAGSLDSKQLLLRGRIKRVDIASHKVGRFIPSEAWQAQTSAPASGTFYKVTDAQRVCIAAPCATFHEAKLNSTISADVHELDFSRVTTNDLLVNEAFTALDQGPILVAGVNGKSAAGRGAIALGATQVYLAVAAHGLSSYQPSESDIAGHTFANENAAPPNYPRTYAFDASSDLVTIGDAVSPCASGAICIWSGIVNRQAHWALVGATIELTFEDSAPTQWNIPYVDRLAVKVDSAGQIVLVELHDDGLRSTRQFR